MIWSDLEDLTIFLDSLPGESEESKVKMAKQKDKFWLRMWIACDRPPSGSVDQIKQKTKREYKYSLLRARLNAWDGPCDKKSWDRVMNSVMCSPQLIRLFGYVTLFLLIKIFCFHLMLILISKIILPSLSIQSSQFV